MKNSFQLLLSFILTNFGTQFMDDSGKNSVIDAFDSGPFFGKLTIINKE